MNIKASWYQVTQTCRQVYAESHRIFFDHGSYYVERSLSFLRRYGYRPTRMQPPFRWETIHALCVKDLVRTKPRYTKKQVDEIISNPRDYRNFGRSTRQELEMQIIKTLDIDAWKCLRHLTNLRTVGLCLRVGEEMKYVDFLYCLTGLRTGLVDFVDASHWLIRPQNPEDEWSIRYACSLHAEHGKDKNGERIPYDRLFLEEQVMDIDSRAPDLQEGDERYVEAQIQWSLPEKPSEETPDNIACDIDLGTAADLSGDDATNQDSNGSHMNASQDQTEDFSQGRILGDVDEFPELNPEREPESHPTDDSSSLETPSESIIEHQPITVREQEGDHTLLQPSSQEISVNQPNTESSGAASGSKTESQTSTDRDQEGNYALLQPSSQEISVNQPNTESPGEPSGSRIEPQTLADRGEQEGDRALLQPASQEISMSQPNTESHNQAADTPLADTATLLPRNAPSGIGDDIFLSDLDDEDSQIQSNKEISNQPAHQALSPHLNDSHGGNRGAQGPREKKTMVQSREGKNKETRFVLRRGKKPLLDIATTPNPYTEEEMESYQTWLRGKNSHGENNSSSSSSPRLRTRGRHEYRGKKPFMSNATAIIEREEQPTGVKQDYGETLVRYIQAGFLFFFFLLLLLFIPG